jgi:hypothetical protein
MPAPQMIETPAMRRSAMLAQLLEQQRQPVEIKGGYGELAARLLGQGITQFSANRADRRVKEENQQRLAGQAEAGNLALARLLGGGGEPPAPTPMAPPVTNTMAPQEAPVAPAAAVAGSPMPPAAPAGMAAAPAPMADVPPAQPAPQAAPATAPRNALSITPGEADLVRRALSSGDPGQIAWAQGVIGEIEGRMSAPPEWKDVDVNGVPYLRDQFGNMRPAFEGGIPNEAQNETFVAGQGNSYAVPAGTLLTRSPEGVVSVVNRQESGYELGPNGRLQPIGGGPQDPAAGENRIRNERELRREYQGATQEYRTVRQAFQKVEASLAQGTGIGDVGGIFGVMKIFDPGSTVREGEAATVQNSGGVPENIRGLYNRVVTGERLTPQQRAEIVAVGRAQFGTYEQSYQSRVADFTRMAEGYGIDPRNVVGSDEAPAPPAPRTPAPRAPAPRRPAPSAPAPRRSNGQTRRYNPNTGQLE